MRLGVLGLVLQGVTETLRRLGQPTQLTVSGPQIVVGRREIGTEPNGMFVVLQSFWRAARAAQGIAEIVAGVCIIGPQPEHFAVAGDRLVQSAQVAQSDPQVIVCFNEPRPQAQHVAKASDRFVVLAEQHEHVAEVVVCLDKVGMKSQRLTIAGGRFLNVALSAADDAQKPQASALPGSAWSAARKACSAPARLPAV